MAIYIDKRTVFWQNVPAPRLSSGGGLWMKPQQCELSGSKEKMTIPASSEPSAEVWEVLNRTNVKTNHAGNDVAARQKLFEIAEIEESDEPAFDDDAMNRN